MRFSGAGLSKGPPIGSRIIPDVIRQFTTACSAHLKRLGYLREVLDIGSRYRRCKNGWDPHLDHSRSFILDTMRECPISRKVIVLGSGLLLDVPIAELSGLFREVILVDILHMPEVTEYLKGWPNVRTVQCDVTGIVESIARLRTATSIDLRSLPEPACLIPEFDETTDLVISLNLLSQIHLWPKQLVGAKINKGEEKTLIAWTRRIIETHYEFLASLPCTVCLITDYEYYARSRYGNILAKESTIEDVQLPVPNRRWVWDIAPLGEMSKDYSVYRNVAGIRFR